MTDAAGRRVYMSMSCIYDRPFDFMGSRSKFGCFDEAALLLWICFSYQHLF
jgi:hypothetical protein